MRLVVGLGNPGIDYDGTRHNVGFDVVDRLARAWGWTKSATEFNRVARARFDGLAIDGRVATAEDGDVKVLLLKPLTFMNRSGRSVKAAMSFYQVPAQDVMVVLDDVALPTGALRMRASGSSGGHNGLRDIQAAVATDAYPRLRIGVGAPPPFIAQADWVLGKFPPHERATVDEALERACDAVRAWLESGIQAAMNRFNTVPRRDEE